MPDAVTHPTKQELAAFGLGKLPERAAAAIAAHLESCPTCPKIVAGVSADSFLGKVRDAGKPGSSIPPSSAQPSVAPSSAGQPVIPVVPCPDVPPELARHPKFLILRELGRGGMGVVYQARQTVMNRPVVIKVINRSLLERPGALERFRREIQAAARLSHPNIVTAYDAEQAGDLHMLVMEFVPGQSLAEVLEKKGPLPVSHACHFARQVALGLQHAHERNLVHRDIKPQNLILSLKNQIKILDFGLAKVVSESATRSGITSSDTYMGTPDYSAPEQAQDARTADIRADLYSLGCTLYCLLAGRPPFHEDTAVKTILAHIQKEAQPLPELRPDVPAALWKVVNRLLAKIPAQRYQTPMEAAQALVPFIKSGSKPEAKGGSSLPPSVKSTRKGTVIEADTNEVKKILRAVPGKVPLKKAPAKSEASPFENLVDAPALPKKSRESTKPARERRPRLWPALVGAGVVLLALLGMWASGVFKMKVKTLDGAAIIVLEVDQPGAEVFVDGQKITVNILGDKKPVEIEALPGQHKLRICKDGFVVESRDVELKSSKSAPIQVRLEPVKAVPKPEEKPPVAAANPAAGADGFVPLFNGKDRKGWVVDSGDENAWQVKDGELVARGTENDNFFAQGYLLTEKEYTDFILRFQFLQVGGKDATSGVALRAVPGETESNTIPNTSSFPFHLTVWLGEHPIPGIATTGSLWWSPNSIVQPLLLPDKLAGMKKVGEWNVMEVEMRGQSLRFSVNGHDVQNVMLNKTRPQRNPAPGLSRFSGRIGFMKRTGEVRYRRFEIKELK